jgi:radical SAM superfamily enzyme YgiQ (UPF0313 family)
MKILLINPKTKFPGKSPPVPLGLLQISALPHKNGHEIEILDCNKTRTKGIKKKMKAADPDVVGFTSWTSGSLKSCIELSKFAKANLNAKVVWGGVHASLLPMQVIGEDYVDIVVIGEGDFTFNEMIENLKHPEKVNGIAFKHRDKIKLNAKTKTPDNLNNLPSIPWKLIRVKNYVFKWIGGLKTFVLPTSRGCPYNCTFCYNRIFYGGGWRPYSADAIKKNLENLITIYPNLEAIRVDCEDNLIGNDPDRAIKISSTLNAFDLKWSCQLRVNNVNEKILSNFKNNGCEYAFFGIESGSQRMLNFLKKGITIDQSIRVFDICNKIGLRPVSSFIIDIPTETNKDLDMTRKLARRLNGIVHAGFYQPYPGTALTKFLEKKGFKMPMRTEEWTEFNLSKCHNFSHNSRLRLLSAYYELNYIHNTKVLLEKRDFDMYFMLLKSLF